MSIRPTAALLPALLLALIMGTALESSAAEFFVTRTDDDTDTATYDGTLRWAIDQVNAQPTLTHIIKFDGATIPNNGTITLSATLPNLIATTSFNPAGVDSVAGLRVVGPADTDTILLVVGPTVRADLTDIEFDLSFVDASGTLWFKVAFDETYDGIVTGSGTLLKTGRGQLHLRAPVNGETIQVNAANLLVDADDLNGNLELTQNGIEDGRVTLFQGPVDPDDSADLGVYDGDISGDGRVIKNGSRTVILTGNNTYTGGTTVEAGILEGHAKSLADDEGSLQGDIMLDSATSVLRFNQASDGSFDGALSASTDGEGSAEKTGDGTLILAIPTPAPNLEEFRVDAGTLRFEDWNAGTPGVVEPPVFESPLVVNVGGTVSGIVRLDAPMRVRGALHPDLVQSGASGASIQGTGQIVLESGATLIVEVRADPPDAGARSRIETSGGIEFESGLTLDVRTGDDDPLTYSTEQSFVVATDASYATGVSSETAFTRILTPTPFLTASAEINGAQEFTVSVVRTSGESIAITPNQRQVARAYDELTTPGNSTADTTNLESAMLTLPSLAVPPAFDTLGADMLASFVTTRFTNSERFARTVAERFTASQYELRYPKTSSDRFTMNAMAEGSPFGRFATPTSTPGTAMGAGLLGSSPYTFSPGRSRDGLGAFIDGFAVLSSLEGGAQSSSVDANIYGTTLGLDYRLPTDLGLPHAEHFRVGIAGSYARSTFESNPSPATGTSNSYHASLYAAYTLPRFYLGVLGRYGYADMTTTRNVELGTLQSPFLETAVGSFSGNEASGYFETGVLIGDPETVLLRPIFAFNYTWVDQAAFSETGAPTIGLDVAGTSTSSMLSTLGFRLSKVIPFDPELWDGGPADEFGVEPELRFGWNRELGDTLRPVNAEFGAAINGGSFQVAAAESQVNSFTVGIGHTMRFHEVALLAMHYDARIDSTRIDHTIRAALYLAW